MPATKAPALKPTEKKALPIGSPEIVELRAIFDHASLGIALLDKSGRVLRMNPSLARMLDGKLARKELPEFVDLLHVEDRPRAHTMITELFGGARTQTVSEFRFIGKTGRFPWGQVSLSLAPGGANSNDYAIALISDITERRESEERLSHRASHDALTGLPNRSLFNERLERAVTRAKRNRLVVAVMFLDLDHFKQINDSLGHLAGDQLLQQVAERLNNAVRRGDTVARLAGDEFTLILEDVADFRDCTTVARKILAQFSSPFDLGGQKARSSPSIGISLFPSDGETASDLVQAADHAMYIAKKEGRGSFRFSSADLSERAFQRQAMEDALELALTKGGLELYYQPVVDLASTRIIGAEALLRWHHPELGLMTPAQFLPLAHDGELAGPLAEWVLHEALTEVAAWRADGHLDFRLGINVGKQELLDPAYFESLKVALATAKVPAEALNFEIPESLAASADADIVKGIQALHSMGSHIVFDDFGAGRTDFRLLRGGLFDSVKLAHDFVRSATENESEASMVRSAIGAAHDLHVAVVAKAVETSNQLDFLRSAGCDAAQGFLFCRAVPSEEFLPLTSQSLLTAG